jgi:hypothetical protein
MRFLTDWLTDWLKELLISCLSSVRIGSKLKALSKAL